jgi:hypothetical protein
LLVLIILILLLVIGYTVRALDGGSRAGSQRVQPRVTSSQPTAHRKQLPQTAQDGGFLAAKAAIPSCACGPAK